LQRGLRHDPVGTLERIDFRSADGTPMIGWLRLPPGFDRMRRYPMIVRADGVYFYPRFNPEHWNWVAEGYIVLAVHHRADEAGHGLDPRHVNFNFDGYLNVETIDDLLGGVDAALALGIVDPERLFIAGSSQGGSLAAYTITRTGRFKAASVMRPTTNTITWIYGKDELDAFRSFSRPFWEDPDTYLEGSSVLFHAHRTKTPVLLMTGDQDWSTPVTESDQYFRLLKLHTDVPVRYVRMPGVHHGWGEDFITFARLQRYTLDWFRQWDEARSREVTP
jgi:acylaminoacyl-peptidase